MAEERKIEVAYNPERRIAMTEDLTAYTFEEIFLCTISHFFILFIRAIFCRERRQGNGILNNKNRIKKCKRSHETN